MASAVTLLPQPDSPTIPSVRPLPARSWCRSPACVRSAAIALKGDPQIPDREQRSRESLVVLGKRLGDEVLELGAIDEARGLLPIGHKAPEMQPALARNLFQSSQLRQGLGVVVYAQVVKGIVLPVMYQQGRRLPTALVAAGRLARLHGGDQAPGKRRLRVGLVTVDGFASTRPDPPAYCRQRCYNPCAPRAHTNQCSPPRCRRQSCRGYRADAADDWPGPRPPRRACRITASPVAPPAKEL